MALAGVLASVVFPSSASAAVGSGSFTALPTARIFDGQVNTTNKVVQIAGLNGVATDATAVMVNTQVFAPTAAGYVRVTPAGEDSGVATQEFVKGQTISNLVAVKLVNGKAQVKVSAGSARILMDVSGFYSPTSTGSFKALPTARIFDGAANTINRQVPIANLKGVPANATAVVMNTQVFAPTAAGYVRVTPAGQDAGVATQHFAKGQTISNLVVVKLVDGMAQVKVSAGSARILMDVAGYYTAGAGASYEPLSTQRIFDGMAGTTNVQVPIANLKGVPANATAVVMNTQVFAPTAAGYVRVTPASQDAGVATQEFAKGQTISNLVVVKLVNGMAQVKVSAGSARILMDVAGYYKAEDVTTPPVAVDTTTVLAVSAISGVAPASPTLTATVTGAGAAGTVEFFNGATTLGTSPVADGVATKALSAVDVGSYSYTAKFIPTDAEAFTPSTSTAIAYVVTDGTAPGPITGLFVKADSSTDTSVALYWVNPTDADYTGVMIRRAEGPTPPATATDGTLVRDLTDLPGQHVAYVVDVGNVIAGTQYSYALFAHDGANNYAAAANVTYTTTTPADRVPPTAVLSFITDAEWFDFDASGSRAALPKTLSTGTVDYGDGTAVETLSDEFGWFSSHSYAAAGDYVVTLRVIDSAGVSATTVKTVTVTPGAVAPTATITGPTGPVQVGTPVEFTLTTTGSPVATWNVQDEDGIFDGSGIGVAPATVTRTYTAAGTFNVVFSFINATGGSAEGSTVVTVVP